MSIVFKVANSVLNQPLEIKYARSFLVSICFLQSPFCYPLFESIWYRVATGTEWENLNSGLGRTKRGGNLLQIKKSLFFLPISYQINVPNTLLLNFFSKWWNISLVIIRIVMALIFAWMLNNDSLLYPCFVDKFN